MAEHAAEHAEGAEYQRGHMPIPEQIVTYRDVMGLTKWGALGVADLLILLVLWFCTGAGFVPAVIVALVVLGIGLFALRKRHPRPAPGNALH